MIPQRILSGVCEITTGAFSIMQRPPVYTGEAAALSVQVQFKFQGVDYLIPANVVAEMYLRYPNTNLMTVAVEMAINGNTASGVLSAKQTGMAGYPLLVIQLTDSETSYLIVACATTVKVSDVRGDLVIDSRAPSPSEIIYVGRSPYINHTTNTWMEWSIDQNAYVDTGVVVGTEVSKKYVDDNLELKADKSTTYTKTEVDTALSGKVNTSSVGAASGVASLDSTGKVPSAQLPSYVDDVIEYDTMSLFPATGEAGKIYVAKDTGYTYRWSGTTYIQISNPQSIIDDTAGDGDTDKVWSADKLHDTIPNISIQFKRLVIT